MYYDAGAPSGGDASEELSSDQSGEGGLPKRPITADRSSSSELSSDNEPVARRRQARGPAAQESDAEESEAEESEEQESGGAEEQDQESETSDTVPQPPQKRKASQTGKAAAHNRSAKTKLKRPKAMLKRPKAKMQGVR